MAWSAVKGQSSGKRATHGVKTRGMERAGQMVQGSSVTKAATKSTQPRHQSANGDGEDVEGGKLSCCLTVPTQTPDVMVSMSQ